MKKCSEIWVGLDIHKDSVSVAALGGGSDAPLLEQQVGPTDQALRRVLSRLARQGPCAPATRRVGSATCCSAR